MEHNTAITTFADSDNLTGQYGTKLAIMLRRQFPGCHYRFSDFAENKAGVDCWFFKGKKRIGVDFKIRRTNPGALTLETISNSEIESPGWLTDPTKITDMVCYYFTETNEWLLVDFEALQEVFTQNSASWSQYERTQETWNKERTRYYYSSKCLFVPMTEILPLLEGNYKKGIL
jgi:hypothetical protein